MKTVEAVFEKGVFRPVEPISLEEGTRVEVVLHPTRPATDNEGKSYLERLAEIAALPVRSPADGFSGAEHDRVLYGVQRKCR